MSRLFIAEKKDIAIAMADHLWSADYERTPHFFKGKNDASGDCVTWASGHILGLAEPALYEEWKDKPRSFYPLFKFHLVYGILSLLLGVLTIINPFTFSQVITIFIGMWVLYLAVLK